MANSRAPQQPEPLAADAVLAWYDRHARTLPWRVSPADRAHGVRPDPYKIWLSEIMLQQTRIGAATRYFHRFTGLWPSVRALAAAPLDAVLVEWAGLGYYARARRLHACAVVVAGRADGQFPRTSADLRVLPGIGPYTAAAIAAIAFEEPIAVVDGNVERLLARYLALEVPVRRAKDLISRWVQQAVPNRAGDFAQALMDLGSTICAPREAMCMRCPLQSHCLGTRGDPLRFPVREAKPERPIRYGQAFVIRDATGSVYLEKRAATGLLAKMTGTPGSPWEPALREPVFPFQASWRRHGTVVHLFTHFRLELAVWSATAPGSTVLPDGWWADAQGLGREALPTLFRKVLAAAGLES